MFDFNLCSNFHVKKILKYLLQFRFQYLPINYKNSDSDVIVSLTSYGSRIDTCHLAIKSILNQTVVPKKILLYIGSESNIYSLSDDLLNLQQYGLQIIRDVPNLKGHKKYFYAMKEYPQSTIITIDDDCMYPKTFIENLLYYHSLFPSSVIARRVHKITVNNNRIAPYSDWVHEITDVGSVPMNSLVAIGAGGVLYPPCFASDDLFDVDLISRYSLNNDDIWLKFFEVRHNISVVWAKNSLPYPYPIPSTESDGLFYTNTYMSGNDSCIESLQEIFHIPVQSFID